MLITFSAWKLISYHCSNIISRASVLGKFDILTKKMSPSTGPHQNNALLLSSSNCHGYPTLEFARSEIDGLLQKKKITELLFIPYAQKDHNAYTKKIKDIIENWGYKVTGLHTHESPQEAIKTAEAIFVGGGNTFVLLKKLYENNLVSLIKERVLDGMVYIGSSAGTNVATKSIHTTNDMPIDYPPSFEGIGIVPFNINPHYLETLASKHQGETRDQRIEEYLEISGAVVVGLREGAILHVDGDTAIIKGVAGAVIFTPGHKEEVPVGTDISHLMKK